MLYMKWHAELNISCSVERAEICYPGNSQREWNHIMLLWAADKALRSYETLPTLHTFTGYIESYVFRFP